MTRTSFFAPLLLLAVLLFLMLGGCVRPPGEALPGGTPIQWPASWKVRYDWYAPHGADAARPMGYGPKVASLELVGPGTSGHAVLGDDSTTGSATMVLQNETETLSVGFAGVIPLVVSVPQSPTVFLALTGDRVTLTWPQVISLPSLLSHPDASMMLPLGVEAETWREAFLNRDGDVVTVGWRSAEPALWKARMVLDGHPWPREIRIDGECTEACEGAPFNQAIFHRTFLRTGGTGDMGAPGPLPAAIQPARATSPALPVPKLDPTGLAISLKDVLQGADTSYNHFKAYAQRNPDWFVIQADFSGSSATGETAWDIFLEARGTGETFGLKAIAVHGAVGARVGMIQFDALEPPAARGAHPSDDRLRVPEVLADGIVESPCGAALPDQVVGMHFSLDISRMALPTRSGAVSVTVRGVGPACADVQAGVYYGINRVQPLVFAIPPSTLPP
jgi:hypothetical protein